MWTWRRWPSSIRSTPTSSNGSSRLSRLWSTWARRRSRIPPGSSRNRATHDLAPRVLGDYRILREIGRGGMGVVYEAEQRSLNRRVALKVLPMAAALDARQFQRFQLEAQAAACLHHNNIVPVFAVGTEGGVPFYAMQYIEGRSLAEVIHELRRAEGLDVEPLAPEAGTAASAGRPLDDRAGPQPRFGPGRGSVKSTARDPTRPTEALRPDIPPGSGAGVRIEFPRNENLRRPLPRPAPATTAATSPASAFKRPRRSITPTPGASSTATSSPRTSCSTPRAVSGSPTSAWPRSRATTA